MKRVLISYDRDHEGLDQNAPDYMEKLAAWSIADQESHDALNRALCEVLYAAHYKMMESCAGYAVDHAAVERLDNAIDMVLEAMPERAKAHFDKLMERPGCASSQG